MTIYQWPNEREERDNQFSGFQTFDQKEGLIRLLEACSSGLSSKFEEAVCWMEQDGIETSDLARRMTELSEHLQLADFPESINLLMAWACAALLAKNPSLQTWRRVRLLMSKSWQLENWLFDAMVLYAERNPACKDSYIQLAKEAIEALGNHHLTSPFERDNKERALLRDSWSERQDKLDEIWWGLRGAECLSYGERPLFKLLAKFNAYEFINAISKPADPYLANSALLAVGVEREFLLWKTCVESAPIAFENNGSWTGSVTLPLLLVIAREALAHRRNNVDTDIEQVKQEIADLSDAIILILSNRKDDAAAIFARWSTWLMRQLLMRGIKEANNVRTLAFVDSILIEAIGRKMPRKIDIQESPSDALSWEAWCYRAVLASHANGKFIDPPDCESFVAEWSISPDEWSGDRGLKLRARADLFVTMTKDIPGDAMHSLAYSIAVSKSPVDEWKRMWCATQTLREIVEFGDADANRSDEYQTRSEAGRLLFLVYCIGIAILDQRAAHCLSSTSLQSRELAKLQEELAWAIREMLEIDDTINREQWLRGVQHLAIRRLIWEDKGSNSEQGEGFRIFQPDDKPTFSDYLSSAKNDVMELAAILQMAHLNESDRQFVRNKLDDASINLSDVITEAKRLSSFDNRRYPFDESLLQLSVS